MQECVANISIVYFILTHTCVHTHTQVNWVVKRHLLIIPHWICSLMMFVNGFWILEAAADYPCREVCTHASCPRPWPLLNLSFAVLGSTSAHVYGLPAGWDTLILTSGLSSRAAWVQVQLQWVSTLLPLSLSLASFALAPSSLASVPLSNNLAQVWEGCMCISISF